MIPGFFEAHGFLVRLGALSPRTPASYTVGDVCELVDALSRAGLVVWRHDDAVWAAMPPHTEAEVLAAARLLLMLPPHGRADGDG